MEHEPIARPRSKADQPMSRRERIILTALGAVIGLGVVALIIVISKLFEAH